MDNQKNNEAKIRAFFADLYPFVLKYFTFPDGGDRDAFFEAMIKDADELTAKHRWKNDLLPAIMTLSIVSHAEDQAERREVLCNRGRTPMASLMEYLIKREVLTCPGTKEQESTSG